MNYKTNNDATVITLGRYTYFGGFGANWHSDERNVQLGDVRVIDNVLHYAYMASFSKKNFFIGMNEISWARLDNKCGRDACLIINAIKIKDSNDQTK